MCHLYMLFKVRGNHSLKKSHYDDREETRRKNYNAKLRQQEVFLCAAHQFLLIEKQVKQKKSVS